MSSCCFHIFMCDCEIDVFFLTWAFNTNSDMLTHPTSHMSWLLMHSGNQWKQKVDFIAHTEVKCDCFVSKTSSAAILNLSSPSVCYRGLFVSFRNNTNNTQSQSEFTYTSDATLIRPANVGVWVSVCRYTSADTEDSVHKSAKHIDEVSF